MSKQDTVFSELFHNELTKVKRSYHAIVGKVENSIDGIWKHRELKPFIHKKVLLYPKENPDLSKFKKLVHNFKPYSIKIEVVWLLIIHLPEDIPFSEFKSHEQTFADAVGGSCNLEHEGRAIKMTITNKRLQKKYNYEFNPALYNDLNPLLKKPMHLPLPLGFTVVDGLIVKDLSTIINILLIGIPNSGKSNVLHSSAYSLLKLNKNRILNPKVIVAMVDLKIGEFKWIKKYGGVYARTPEEALTLFQQLVEENERRALIMENDDSRKFTGWLKKNRNEMPFIVIIVDELALLANECPDAFSLLQKLSSTGRSQGFCIIGATQRPSHTISKKVSFKDLQAMFEATIAMRVSDSTNARMAMKDDKAANLEKVAGRAIYEWDVSMEIQTLYFPDPDESKEDEKLYNSLLDDLDQIPEKFYFEGGVDVHDQTDIYTQKGILPRSVNYGTSRNKNMSGHKSNPFTYLSRG